MADYVAAINIAVRPQIRGLGLRSSRSTLLNDSTSRKSSIRIYIATLSQLGKPNMFMLEQEYGGGKRGW
ncbi:MAG TPA: hypothetical protein VEL11_10135 [Candidatus Bathyarchaeia archaeon]|nr:hypothetical protein [Candidatus Bathyarchaeia archaeon]